MKAVTYARYGGPEVLRIRSVDDPKPENDEIRIRVITSTVTTVDTIFRQGVKLAARLFTGPIKPRRPILGNDIAGVVDAVGSEVTLFSVGDHVVASAFGAHAELVCLPETEAIAKKPEGTTWEEAAAFCEGGLTAFPFLRDTGKVARGDQVLVIGASGSVGSAGVQLAKHLGAEVTGVCGTSNVEFVRSLGADHVIDYRKEDFTTRTAAFDVVFDAAGKSSFGACRSALKPGGRFLEVDISLGILFSMVRTSILGNRKALFTATGARPAHKRAQDLATLCGWVENGTLKPVVGKVFSMDEVADAHAYVEGGGKRGNVVLRIGPDPTP